MYQVPATRSSVVQFVMTCPGMSHSSTFTPHMRVNGEVDDGKVWGDLCREKRVNIAYRNMDPFFWYDPVATQYYYHGRWVWSQGMWRYHGALTENYSFKSYQWEILQSFFDIHDIVPVWIPCDTSSVYDEELGRWTGLVGQVRERETKSIAWDDKRQKLEFHHIYLGALGYIETYFGK